jgi:hypothetical protein
MHFERQKTREKGKIYNEGQKKEMVKKREKQSSKKKKKKKKKNSHTHLLARPV